MSYERMHGNGICDCYESFDRQRRAIKMTVPPKDPRYSDDSGDQRRLEQTAAVMRRIAELKIAAYKLSDTIDEYIVKAKELK